MNSQRLAKALIGQFPHRAFAKVLSINDLSCGVTLPGLGLDPRPARYKSLGVFRAIRAANARVPFPQLCSPDLDPIEQAYAKTKQASERRRPVPGSFWRAVGKILGNV